MSGYLYLIIAITAEVIATSMLKATEGFTRLLPSLGVIVGYGISFLALSIVVKTVPLGVAYAIWSGLGIVVVSLVAWIIYQQKLDWAAMLGMGLIIAGVLVINLASKTSGH